MDAVAERVPQSAVPLSLPDPSVRSRRADARQAFAIVVASVSGAAAVVTAVVGLVVLSR